MGAYRLCSKKKAEYPYFIESINVHIYTVEELCFYLRQNIYLIDETIMNEELCHWIRDELGLKRLAKKLTERLLMEEPGQMAGFILSIFKETKYLSAEEYRYIQDQIAKVEIQPEDLRRKMKADYLVKYEMYGNAIRDYYLILKDKNPGKLGIQFYAAVLNNMACAYGKLFLFEEAADCLLKSYGIVPSNEVWNNYLSVLSLFLDKEEYEKRLQELSIPKEQIRYLEQKKADFIKEEIEGQLSKTDQKEFLKQKKEKYLKSMLKL